MKPIQQGKMLLFSTLAVGVVSWLLADTYGRFILYGLLLLAPAIEDGYSGYISDGWSLLLAVSGVVTACSMGHLSVHMVSFTMVAILYALLRLYKKEAVGMGDGLLSVSVSLWLTPAFAMLFLWLASVVALVIFGLLSLLFPHRNDSGIRFAPFLALGGVIAYGLQETVGFSLFTPLWIYFG